MADHVAAAAAVLNTGDASKPDQFAELGYGERIGAVAGLVDEDGWPQVKNLLEKAFDVGKCLAFPGEDHADGADAAGYGVAGQTQRLFNVQTGGVGKPVLLQLHRQGPVDDLAALVKRQLVVLTRGAGNKQAVNGRVLVEISQYGFDAIKIER